MPDLPPCVPALFSTLSLGHRLSSFGSEVIIMVSFMFLLNRIRIFLQLLDSLCFLYEITYSVLIMIQAVICSLIPESLVLHFSGYSSFLPSLLSSLSPSPPHTWAMMPNTISSWNSMPAPLLSQCQLHALDPPEPRATETSFLYKVKIYKWRFSHWQ